MTRLFERAHYEASVEQLEGAQIGGHFKDQLEARIAVLEKAEGVKYDTGKPRLELISPIAMEELGKVLAYGAQKYADRNWEKGMAWSRIVGSLLRHLFAYMRGERVDKESGCSHLSHVLCNAHFLVHYEAMHPEFDDLPKGDR